MTALAECLSGSATLATTSRGFARSTTPLPLLAHAPQDAIWQLHYFNMTTLALVFL